MIYFRHYIEAYDRATKDLSMLEDGAYERLLRHYYAQELPLPLDPAKLARICRAVAPEERKAMDSVLTTFFDRRADGWHNERADEEIRVANTARANGSKNTGAGTGAGTQPRTHPRTHPRTDDGTDSGTGGTTTDETTTKTGSGHPFSLSTKTSLSTTTHPLNQNHSADAAHRGAKRTPPGITNTTWDAYRSAYFERYRVDPVRNARVNSQLSSLVRCIGITEAPAIARFYVTHNRAAYVQAKHSTSLLARDAEGLRTEWARGQQVSETEARQADRTMATASAFAPLLEEARAKANA